MKWIKYGSREEGKYIQIKKISYAEEEEKNKKNSKKKNIAPQNDKNFTWHSFTWKLFQTSFRNRALALQNEIQSVNYSCNMAIEC